MPRYYFDVTDEGGARRDAVGVECPDLAAARAEAVRVLPDIARHEMPKDGDRHLFTVIVRDGRGCPVYTATLGFAGLWLTEVPR